jgi:hypothetical protein
MVNAEQVLVCSLSTGRVQNKPIVLNRDRNATRKRDSQGVLAAFASVILGAGNDATGLSGAAWLSTVDCDKFIILSQHVERSTSFFLQTMTEVALQSVYLDL